MKQKLFDALTYSMSIVGLVIMLNIQFGEYLWGSGADSVEYRLVVLPRIYWLMIPFITGLYLWRSRNTK